MSDSDGQDSETVCVKIKYRLNKDTPHLANEWQVKPQSYKTYKDFINAARHFVGQDYQPIESVTAIKPDGTKVRMNEHKFSLEKENSYIVAIMNPAHDIKLIKEKFYDIEKRYDEFFSKR